MNQSIKTIILSTICKCLHFLFLPFLDGFVNRRTFYPFPYKINDDIQYLLTVCPMTSSKLRHSRGAVYCIIQYLVPAFQPAYCMPAYLTYCFANLSAIPACLPAHLLGILPAAYQPACLPALHAYQYPILHV